MLVIVAVELNSPFSCTFHVYIQVMNNVSSCDTICTPGAKELSNLLGVSYLLNKASKGGGGRGGGGGGSDEDDQTGNYKHEMGGGLVIGMFGEMSGK